MSMDDLRVAIEKYLAETGHNQQELALKAQVSSSLISRIRAGKQQDVMGRNYQRLLAVLQAQEK